VKGHVVGECCPRLVGTHTSSYIASMMALNVELGRIAFVASASSGR
jgi:hypothetical protein